MNGWEKGVEGEHFSIYPFCTVWVMKHVNVLPIQKINEYNYNLEITEIAHHTHSCLSWQKPASGFQNSSSHYTSQYLVLVCASLSAPSCSSNLPHLSSFLLSFSVQFLLAVLALTVLTISQFLPIYLFSLPPRNVLKNTDPSPS